MANIRYWSDEGSWHRVDFNYVSAKIKNKTIVTVEDGENDGRGLLLHLGNGAIVQVPYEGDTFGIHYYGPQ